VRAIDDPENPYRSQYRDWDHWIYAHAGTPTEEQARADLDGKAPTGWYDGFAAVDRQGFMVPWELSERAGYERLRPREGEPPCSCSFRAFGVMEPQMLAGLEAAEVSIAAQYYPPIPAWLAVAPPKLAQLLPDGKVATKGALGSYDGSGVYIMLEQGWTETDDPWYLYSADGQLLRETPPGGWQEHLFDGSRDSADPLDALPFDNWVDMALQRAAARGCRRGMEIDPRGYFIFRERNSSAVRFIYDYDGTPLPADFNTLSRDGNSYVSASGEYIARLYAAQQNPAALNRTSATTRGVKE
jgi:hypothetical protein